MIVCPKCRQHAQITETGKKTLRCQRCSAILETRRLRILYSTDELAEAVTFRTRLQAELSGSLDLEKIPEPSGKRVSRELPPKNDRSICFALLLSAGGEMELKAFQQKAFENGISQEKFEFILKKLLEIGELYSPEPGRIKIV